MSAPDDLGHELARLNQFLLVDESLDASLQRVADLARRGIPRCDTVGVSLAEQGRVLTRVATDPVSLQIDEHQYETGEGPCLDAIRHGRSYRIADTADEQRWPNYVPRAMKEGLVSSLSVPLGVGDQTVGALNLYSLDEPFDDADFETAVRFAAEAAVPLANAQGYQRLREMVANLNVALETRDVIGQAKGIIMATSPCDANTAFDALRVESQRRNIKLREVAQEVVDRLLGS